MEITIFITLLVIALLFFFAGIYYKLTPFLYLSTAFFVLISMAFYTSGLEYTTGNLITKLSINTTQVVNIYTETTAIPRYAGGLIFLVFSVFSVIMVSICKKPNLNNDGNEIEKQ